MERMWAGVLAVVVAVGLAACDDGDDGDETGGRSGATEAAEVEPLRILVTNDDGVSAPGIDALVTALEDEPDVEVTVVAPAENRSGTGDDTTPGDPAALTVAESETASGHPATAVRGFPADTVAYALATDTEHPDLVISGVNEGQNLGPLAENVSGTVGAARAAASAGIPALAVSQGLGDPIDYDAGVAAAIDWLEEHRDQLGEGAAAVLVNLNVPSCATGEVRDVIEVPLSTSTEEAAAGTQDCASTLTDPVDDVQAFNNGFVTLTELEPAVR